MTETCIQLRAGGVSVLVLVGDGRLPRVLHWGADLGELSERQLASVVASVAPPSTSSRIDVPEPVPVLPQLAEGWIGRPGLVCSRGGRGWAPLFTETSTTRTDAGVRTEATDAAGGLALTIELELLASGLLRGRASVRNTAEDAVRVDGLELRLPIPSSATEVLDFAGRWAKERVPQRRELAVGQWVREARGGRPGLDSPFLLAAGTPAFGFRSGEVWATHLGWSGNQVYAAERTYTGTATIGAAELLLPNEITLAHDAEYTSPWLYASYGMGLDAVAARFHAFLRGRPGHPGLPRPIGLNTWEAVYFNHDLDRLLRLADRAAELGIERFVLDDGWFLGRRNDRSGLGDWFVDPEVWPQGLTPLAERVRRLGMQFGLWFEPEMVSPGSRLATEHPDWLFDAGHGRGVPGRHQYVLDLGHDEAYAFMLERMSSLIAEYGIGYVKWDHNRPLTDAGHQPNGVPGVHAQTLAVYRLMDELKRRHPGLEIESCASGGGRIDLGILEHADRVWVSDCIDPHERLETQRHTGLIVPPELQGTHFGSERAHTTGRTSTAAYRGEKALWGHFGVEADVVAMPPDDAAALSVWIGLHKEYRRLLHTGLPVHADLADAAYRLEGVISADAGEGLFAFSCVDWPGTTHPGRVGIPGLRGDTRYRVSSIGAVGERTNGAPWMRQPLTLPGSVLREVGLEMPIMLPDRSVLLHVAREPSGV